MLQLNLDTHEYSQDGRPVTSVTQYLSRTGVRDGDEGYWNSISGAEYATDAVAAQFGREFHTVAEMYLKGEEVPDYDPAMEPWVEGFRKFRRDHGYLETYIHEGRPVIERSFYCKTYRYAMTLDWLPVDPDGGVYLLDWKTGTAWCKHWWLQGAAYVRGVVENIPELRSMPVWIVKIGEGTYEKREHSPREVRSDFNQFLSILNVHRMAG